MEKALIIDIKNLFEKYGLEISNVRDLMNYIANRFENLSSCRKCEAISKFHEEEDFLLNQKLIGRRRLHIYYSKASGVLVVLLDNKNNFSRKVLREISKFLGIGIGYLSHYVLSLDKDRFLSSMKLSLLLDWDLDDAWVEEILALIYVLNRRNFHLRVKGLAVKSIKDPENFSSEKKFIVLYISKISMESYTGVIRELNFGNKHFLNVKFRRDVSNALRRLLSEDLGEEDEKIYLEKVKFALEKLIEIAKNF